MIAITILLVLLYYADSSMANRLPLEVFEVPQSTQVYSTSGNYLKHKTVYSHHTDRRRSRQMMDVLQPRGTRILYQVGTTEEDLPICAPNAVCSKIDLYDTPWIERQCRCPDPTKGPITITHHKDNFVSDPKYINFDEEKNAHHKHLLDLDEKQYENVHLKKLLQKFGAVYQDDIMLDENDFQDNEDLNNAYQAHKTEFGLGIHKDISAQLKNHDNTKLRHSAHRKDIPSIGGCPSGIGIEDGHTIADKTRHYKLCNSVHKLPICRYFRDYTWSLSSSPEANVTEQIVHCRCPRNSVTYLTKREPLSAGRVGYTYLFACSPQSRLRCQRKEPCKLFTVRKRQEFLDEVNTNPLCQCPKGHRCPKHHTDPGVISGKSYIEDNIQTYSGYCMAND